MTSESKLIQGSLFGGKKKRKKTLKYKTKKHIHGIIKAKLQFTT